MKVIGCTYYDSKEFVTNEALQNDEEHIASLIKEIRDKGYLFSGEDHINNLYCAPVFEDYTCGRYSEEAFSGIMALAHDEEDPNKYLRFESIEEADRRL
nr:hypothetical protein [Bacilli bacterium]